MLTQAIKQARILAQEYCEAMDPGEFGVVDTPDGAEVYQEADTRWGEGTLTCSYVAQDDDLIMFTDHNTGETEVFAVPK